MINDQYFPLEANLADDDRLCLLIEQMGMEGMGIYLTLLMELRRRDNYQFSLQSVPRMARNMCSTSDKVLHIITSFNLFHVEGDMETGIVSSPYLDKVMERLEAKREKRRLAALKGYKSIKRAVNGCFTADSGAEEKSKEENSKVEENKSEESTSSSSYSSAATVEEDEATAAIKSWDKYINEAINEQSWLELSGKQSGLGLDYINHLPFIIGTFREHILIQGTENRIVSLGDAKSYFANYIRDGTPTNKRVRELLIIEKKRREKENPYRYEDINSVTGTRSFCGIPIPADSPPRPGPNSMWNEMKRVWEG